MRMVLAAALALAGAAAAFPLAAQQRWTGGLSAGAALPAGTLADYVATGPRVALSLRRPSRSIAWRIDAAWSRFGTRTVTRGYNGGAIPIDITSSATFASLAAGPELSVPFASRWHVAVALEAGVTHVQASGATILAGDPAQVQRATTFGTTTWQATASVTTGVRLSPATSIGVEIAGSKAGEASFLREYNLPIGVISGVYLNPTPYAPSFATISAWLRVRM